MQEKRWKVTNLNYLQLIKKYMMMLQKTFFPEIKNKKENQSTGAGELEEVELPTV